MTRFMAGASLRYLPDRLYRSLHGAAASALLVPFDTRGRETAVRDVQSETTLVLGSAVRRSPALALRRQGGVRAALRAARAAVDFKFAPPREGPEGSIPGEGEAVEVAGTAATLDNVLVNDPSVDTAGGTLISAFNDSGSLLLNSSAHFDGFARSTDVGATWTDRGRLSNRAFGSAGDPVLSRDTRTGRIYFSTLYYSQG
jgi:hypothetical protein